MIYILATKNDKYCLSICYLHLLIESKYLYINLINIEFFRGEPIKIYLQINRAQNTFNNRNLISAYSSLDGQSSFAVGDHKNGMYALAIMEYLEQPNIPLVKMFSLVNQFVVDYAQREFGGLVEVPHADFTRFDEDFCLYAPISEE